MQFVHIIIFPLLIFVFSFLLQKWMDKNAFSNFYKLYFIGIVSGIIIHLIMSIFNPIFDSKPHHMIIFFKSLFIDGILFSVLLTVTLYFVIDFFCDISLNLDWPMTSLLSLAYISGIYTVFNIIQALSINFPDSFLFYFSYIPFLLLISIVIGFGIPRYLDAYDLIEKIIWGAFTVGIPSVCFTLYSYLRFYNYAEHYLFILPFIGIAAVFELKEFKDFR
jgi:hypothetical protein